MGEAKRKRDRYRKAIENNERWILFPGENGELCSGSFEYFSNLIAKRYAWDKVYETVYKDIEYELIEKLERYPERYPTLTAKVNRVWNETYNRMKSTIREHCAKYGKYQFNILTNEEGEIVDCEELTYRPELDPDEKLP